MSATTGGFCALSRHPVANFHTSALASFNVACFDFRLHPPCRKQTTSTQTPDGNTVISNPVNGTTGVTTTAAATPMPTRDLASLSNPERAFLRNYVSITLQQGVMTDTFEILDVYSTPTSRGNLYVFISKPQSSYRVLVQQLFKSRLMEALAQQRGTFNVQRNSVLMHLPKAYYWSCPSAVAYIATFGQVFEYIGTTQWWNNRFSPVGKR